MTARLDPLTLAGLAALFGLSVAALVPAAPARVLGRLLPVAPRRGLRGRRVPLPLLLGPVAALAVWLAAGPVVGTLTASAAVAVVSAVGLLRRHRSQRTVNATRRSVSRAGATLGSQLRAGLAPQEALRRTAEDWPVMAPAAAALALGGDPAQVWDQQADVPGCRGLQELARGWRLCLVTGAALAPTLERLADALEADEALAVTVGSELASPRATGRIMAVLPFVGLALGYAMGGDPLEFLLQTTAGRSCLLGGCVLAAGGVWWIEAIAGRVAHEL